MCAFQPNAIEECVRLYVYPQIAGPFPVGPMGGGHPTRPETGRAHIRAHIIENCEL